jgi:hypothetical protein
LSKGCGEVIDELGGGDEQSVETVLDGPVGESDGEMSFAAAGLAEEDQAAALGDEVWGKGGAKERKAQGGLIGEVEFIDGL